jgi:hypothetical protein
MKKILTLLFICISFISIGQVKLLIDEVDPFTGSVQKVTDFITVADGPTGRIAFSFVRVETTYGIYAISNKDLGCAGARGNVLLIKFASGKILELKDTAEIGCNKNDSSVFIIKPEDFKDDEVVLLRLVRSNGQLDGSWSYKKSIYELIKYLD